MDVSLQINPGTRHEYSAEVMISGNSLFKGKIHVDHQEVIYLGELKHLRDSQLDVIIHVVRIDPSTYPEIEYRIIYGAEIVEKKLLRSEDKYKKLSIFHIKFKFCPRPPFC
jgi:hypothetical protein